MFSVGFFIAFVIIIFHNQVLGSFQYMCAHVYVIPVPNSDDDGDSQAHFPAMHVRNACATSSAISKMESTTVGAMSLSVIRSRQTSRES